MKNDITHRVMEKDGWLLYTERGEDLDKYVLENKKYNYRDFIYKKSGTHSQYQSLLNNLQIKIQFKKIWLPYSTNFETLDDLVRFGVATEEELKRHVSIPKKIVKKDKRRLGEDGFK